LAREGYPADFGDVQSKGKKEFEQNIPNYGSAGPAISNWSAEGFLSQPGSFIDAHWHLQ